MHGLLQDQEMERRLEEIKNLAELALKNMRAPYRELGIYGNAASARLWLGWFNRMKQQSTILADDALESALQEGVCRVGHE